MTRSPPEPQVVELRQYSLHPGRRDELIELFERELLETQEAVGMQVLGQFRDLGDTERFAWLRGFPDMATRPDSLGAFYSGPVWEAHRDAANATMIDSDNVWLLRPAWPGAGIGSTPHTRAAPGATALPAGLLDTSVFPLRMPADDALLSVCQGVLTPLLVRGGAMRIGWYLSVAEQNNFPRLPVRNDGPVLAGLALFESPTAFDAFARSGAWARDGWPALAPWLAGPAESRRLVPTSRSALHA